MQRAAVRGGWKLSTYHSLDELHDCYCVDLYRVPEIGYTREAFRRTVALARQHGVKTVVPWIALGCGYRRQTGSEPWRFSLKWDYDLIYSWQLGREINHPWFSQDPERFAPWDYARFVCFYPGPDDSRCPYWWKHFVAYVRGATGVKELP